MPRIAIFPGSFDPFTTGHASIVRRALPLFDHIIVAIGYNEGKHAYQPLSTRIETLERLYRDDSRVSVSSYTGLTVDFALQQGAQFILRGVRSVKDFEYERDMADTNRQLSGIETILLYAEPHLAHVSSSLVRELAAFGRDVSPFIPR